MQECDAADEPLKNKREAARYLGISVGTLERIMRARKITYIKLTAGAVRFRLADLVNFVEARLVRGAGDVA